MSEHQRILEVQMLSYARRTRAAMELAVKELEQYEFTEQVLRWIWEKFRSGWKKGELPRIEHINAQINIEPLEAHEPLMEAVLEVWKAAPSTSPLSDCSLLRHYHRHDRMTRGMDKAVKAMSRGDLDNARDVMAALAQETSTAMGLKVETLLDLEDWDRPAEGYGGIPTGIATYDEVTLGGANRGDLGVVLGNTGMGKSLLVTNIGWTGIKHNLRVLHLDSENGMDRVKARYISRALRVPSNPLLRRRISDDVRAWMQRQSERINSLLKLVNIMVDTTSLDELDAKIFEIISTGWKPDIIITDSPDHCVVASKSDNAGMIAQMKYARMKSIAQRADAVHWTVTQAKAESEGKIVTNKHIAWGYDKARLADHILTINPGLDEHGNPLNERAMGNKRSLFVAKARGSPARFILPLVTDLATSYITEGTDHPTESLHDDGGN
jgi:KaiC/GvpD/RAD55 family RecA-like ATPase